MHNSPHLHSWMRTIARADAAVVVHPVLALSVAVPPGVVQLRRAQLTRDLAPGLYVLHEADVRTPADVAEDGRHGYVPFTHAFIPPHVMATASGIVASVRAFAPHVLHALETQTAGYTCLEVTRRLGSVCPPWMLSSWGSDLSLYRKVPSHRQRLEAVCSRVDLYMPDCARDHPTAQAMGYRGPRLPPLPASGGVDVEAYARRATEPPSLRRQIVVKGYQNWAGRAYLALSALVLARDALRDYTIVMPELTVGAGRPARHMLRDSGLTLHTPARRRDHGHALDRLASARVVLSISMSDGIPMTTLEAMATGALPIQSTTACADEWLRDGETGLLVSPHDTAAIRDAVVRAVTDDALVDEAAQRNLDEVRRRWDIVTNGRQAWEAYDRAC